VSRNSHNASPTLASMLPARSLVGCWSSGGHRLGVLVAEQVGDVVLHVDGLCIEAMWMFVTKISDLTGEAGVKVMKGMAWDVLGEDHDDVTKVALDREDNDPVEEKSKSLSLDVMEAESSASESARAMVARMAVLIYT
jgi:hypothetical protein